MTKRRPRRRRRSSGRSKDTAPARVFISYAAEDRNHVRLEELLESLNRVNILPWLDRKELAPGQNFRSGLVKAFEECDACVFLLTENSQGNAWCAAELAAFWAAKKKVHILTADPELKIDTIAPQFVGTVWTERVDEVVRDLQQLRARNPTSPATLATMTSRDLDALIMRSARKVTGKLEQQVGVLSSRLSGLLPFDDKSIFGERYDHFFHEKRAIAGRFMESLADHVARTADGERIRLVLDSGTTIFPIFGLLLEHKRDPSWTSKIEIVTNNIPGVLVMLRDGRAQDDNPHSTLAFDVHVVAGDPSPAYWALLPSAPEREMARLTVEKTAATIGVTTGNWALANGKGLFVRGDQHASFKRALMACSSAVYVLLPVGKMIEKSEQEVNDSLAGSHPYTTVELPSDKERFLVTTRRDRHEKMYDHWHMLKNGLQKLSETDRRFRVLWVEPSQFRITDLVVGGRFTQEDLEMPHRPHRKTLMDWFDWNSSGPE